MKRNPLGDAGNPPDAGGARGQKPIDAGGSQAKETYICVALAPPLLLPCSLSIPWTPARTARSEPYAHNPKP